MPAYVPNATQTTEPVESRTVESAALEFRTLKSSINSRIADLEAKDDLLDTEDAALQAEIDAVEVRTLALEQLAFNGSTPGTVVVQRFVTDAIETAFTLGVTPVTVAAVDAYINGVYQNHDTFSVSGNVVTFSEAPAAGILELQVSVPLQIGVTTADAVEYTPAGTGAVPTTVQSKLREMVSVKDFGAVGDGVADDTAAFNAAIAYANAKGGDDRANVPGTSIIVPPGRYKITSVLNPITVSSVEFVGVSSADCVLLVSSTTSVFTFGNAAKTTTPVGGGARSLKIEYSGTPAAGAVVFKVDYAFSLVFDDLMLENIGSLASLGQASDRIAGGVVFSKVRGSVANAGHTVFQMKYGAGLTLTDCGLFVRGVLPPTHPASMTTVYNTNVFGCTVGFWDTLMVTNCIFERFDRGVACTAAVGMTYQNFYFSNTIMDYFRRWCVFLDATGGVISGVRFDDSCWFVSWEESAIFVIQSAGGGIGINDAHRFGGMVVIAGKYGIYYQVANAKVNSFSGMLVSACNRLGVAQGAIQFASGSKGFTVSNAQGNHDTTAVGAPWRCDYGIVVGADCDEYLISGCQMDGAAGGYYVNENAAGSTKRRMFNNVNANYAGHKTQTIPVSGATYTNTTPFVEEWSFFGGTITGGYSKNGYGFPGALGYVHFRLQPNDSFVVGYSVAPTIQVFVEP